VNDRGVVDRKWEGCAIRNYEYFFMHSTVNSPELACSFEIASLIRSWLVSYERENDPWKLQILVFFPMSGRPKVVVRGIGLSKEVVRFLF